MSNPPASSLRRSLLCVAYHDVVSAPDAEAGVARLAELAEIKASALAWHEAIAAALREGLVYDPVRLSPGALQCHWRLDLTQRGMSALVAYRKS